MNKLRADFGTGMLGAFGGLFSFAVFLLVDRVVVYWDYMARVMAEEGYVEGYVEDLWWMPFSLWHVLVFVLASFLAHRYFAHRVNSTFLLWQLIGLAAFCAWGLTFSTAIAMDELMRPGSHSFERLPNLTNILYIGKFIATVAASNVVYASFIQSAARQYAQESGRWAESSRQ